MNHTTVKRLLASTHGVPAEFVRVRSRPTVADLFKPEERCGIYVLRFTNGHYYVGQAVDVTRRYVQHLKIWDDIQELSFSCVPQDDLDRIEQKLVERFEAQQVRLRNVNLTSIPKGDADLDLVVPRAEQDEWLARNDAYELQGQSLDEPVLREKQEHKFARLLRHPRFDDAVRNFLSEYLSRCIPQPHRTERSFWSLTCLTRAFSTGSGTALCRLNVFWADALSIWFDRDLDDLKYSFRATKSLLPKGVKATFKVRSLTTYRIAGDARGGPDQIYVEVDGVRDASELLRNGRFLTAVKTFNLRQMQMGATSYARYHCLALAQFVQSAESRVGSGKAPEPAGVK